MELQPLPETISTRSHISKLERSLLLRWLLCNLLVHDVSDLRKLREFSLTVYCNIV